MKGTLHKTESGWVVRYSVFNEPHNINLEVSKISLTNPDLSTYWVEGREVNFIKNFLPRMDTNEDIFIIPDEETWDDIFKKVYEDDSIMEFHQIFTWLKQNYQTPKRK